MAIEPTARNLKFIWTDSLKGVLFSGTCVFALATHLLKLEQYREEIGRERPNWNATEKMGRDSHLALWSAHLTQLFHRILMN